jgi:putative acetyltransferase
MFHSILIRPANTSNVEAITTLFRSTIETVNAKDYLPQQVKVWASGANDQQRWLQMIEQQFFYVAELYNQITGFASITHDGHIDLMYVHKDFQGKGIASQLLTTLEQKAFELKLPTIYTDSSITAKPFFLSKGFAIEKEYIKLYGGVEFKNTILYKFL